MNCRSLKLRQVSRRKEGVEEGVAVVVAEAEALLSQSMAVMMRIVMGQRVVVVVVVEALLIQKMAVVVGLLTGQMVAVVMGMMVVKGSSQEDVIFWI